MIVDDAKQKVALFLKNFYNKGNVGTGGNSTFPSATSLDVPVLTSNASVTTSISSDTTIDFLLSLDGGTLEGNTIREIGFFSENMPVNDGDFTEMINEGVSPAVGSSEATGGASMLARIVFDAIGPFQSTDVLNFTFTMEVE